LEEHIEADMNNPRMEEHRDNKSKPLVWLGGLVDGGAGVVEWFRERVLEAGKAAELSESAESLAVVCGVRTAPLDDLGAVLDSNDIVHARNVAGAHVNEDPGRGTDHGVEGGVDFDGRFGEDGYKSTR
jgi:hypothetical protein